MHRQPLLQLLNEYQARGLDRDASAARVAEFVGAQPRCFERSLEVGHVTGSAWIVDPSRGVALLTHHRKLGMWLQLGGHADGDPDIRAVALREAREESGLEDIALAQPGVFDVDVHEIPARVGARPEPAHFHYDVRFLFHADSSLGFRVSDESLALAWVPLASLLERSREFSAPFRIDESVRRMAKKCLPDSAST